jgi:hypothetical protein
MSKQAKPIRRWFQFSLRTFLILVAVIAAWLGTQFNRPPITRDNIHQVEAVSQFAKDVWEIEWSRDGGRVAMLGWEQPVEIYEAKTLIHYRTLAADIGGKFTPDSTRLITAGGSGARSAGDRKVQNWAVPARWRRWLYSQ